MTSIQLPTNINASYFSLNGLILAALHWKCMAGNKQNEWLQQAKPVSKFMSAHVYCLRKTWRTWGYLSTERQQFSVEEKTQTDLIRCEGIHVCYDPCPLHPHLHRRTVIEQLWPLIFSLLSKPCMTAGLCKWPHWTSNWRPLWPCYLLEDLANLTHYSSPVPSRCTVGLSETGITGMALQEFLCITATVLNISLPFPS